MPDIVYSAPPGSGGGGSGTVTSVGVTTPSYLTVTGSPITTAGTIAITGTSESANLVLASPNGSSGALTPRALVVADMPATGTASSTTFFRGDGTWAVPPGSGSGTVTSVSLTVPSGFSVSGSPITTSGTLAISGILAVSAGGTGTSSPGLVAGTNITVTGSWPNQTINSSGSGSSSYSALTGYVSVALSAQTASITATNVVASPTSTYLYEMSYYMTVSTAGTAGTCFLVFAWNDGAAQTFSTETIDLSSTGAGSFISGKLVVKSSSSITYATTVTGATGSPQYSLNIRSLPLG